ncbi:MAG: pyrroloquinoline quinone biosynthesis protein PqqB [Acidobacteria bacterium]|nr:pyrroloquinoline quinone biosynthesis protein PqqB [Acidobacteriota bacterium]
MWLMLAVMMIGQEPQPYVVVLGVAQDAGVPQAGTQGDPAWDDPHMRRFAACLGLVDPASGQRWMFEATPDFKYQLHHLNTVEPADDRPGLNGIFITHAHIGHYTGLMHLGHEVMGAQNVPVFVMPRMAKFLASNGPWDQLVRYKNLQLHHLEEGAGIRLTDHLTVTPFRVPHREEYSEVVGYRIQGPHKSVLFLPDIDKWERFDAQGTRIEMLIESVDYAFLDATFYADGEIPGRAMTEIPHPFITESMDRFDQMSEHHRKKIIFIHLNHTNPALNPTSDAAKTVRNRGYTIAVEGLQLPL